MDLNSLKDQVSNLTLYDLKAGFRKAQNGRLRKGEASWPVLTRYIAVMNYTEMEAKVREATNNEPWGERNLARREGFN
jgi:epsin